MVQRLEQDDLVVRGMAVPRRCRPRLSASVLAEGPQDNAGPSVTGVGIVSGLGEHHDDLANVSDYR